ncbi:putative AP-3 adaptor complex subunit MU [Aspergillus steynii IBT 23096]|uniref:Putative AP-3 adaptor complex subunit MU n=1 Tax=Aspergillus steynii IBT 23096 TaxID=1392250 RepID=A0A2I2GBL5_9EURO|nr:putative AP-3 adaptor complex subunit MU [Aspergillus steynii IBT 23096]PLB50280.1 putative AP-3 adaptor complex subunit MU [Aspergillus steynii IBT 23096]
MTACWLLSPLQTPPAGMMSGEIDALYIYDEQNSPLVEQVYRSRPPSAAAILPLYLEHPAPRPSLLYLPSATPPVTVFSIVQSNLLFLALSEVDTEPLLVLEFLHRVVDILEDFVGAPLLSSKVQANYDVVAQLLHEMCDAGIVCNTESNAIQEVVEMPGWMGKLLGGVGLPGSSTPILGSTNPLKQSLAANAAAQGPAIPWRRSGVRHTSNELYVDIIESLSVTMAPSGRLLSALVSGTIAFTAKISGVPDLLLSLTTPGGQQAIGRKVDLPVFHPCVRLARWREKPGELSFVPPDGRFILAGYEVDLLPMDASLDQPPKYMEKIFLPASVNIRKSLGTAGSEFEVRLLLNTNFPGQPSTNRPGAGRGGSGTSTPSFLGGGGNSSGPVLEDVVVSVPIPKSVRNITDMQASRGDAVFSPNSHTLEWRVPTKDAGTVSGTAVLRCTVVGYQPVDDDLDDDVEDVDQDANLLQGYYDASASTSYQNAEADTIKRKTKKKKKKKVKKSSRAANALPPTSDADNQTPDPDSQQPDDPQAEPPAPQPQQDPSSSSSALPPPPPPQNQDSIFHTAPRKTKSQLNANLMPNSASVSFSVRGWLPSGIKVDSLNIDPRRSRGLGEGVKPYKGVKYLCVSRKGVERRC